MWWVAWQQHRLTLAISVAVLVILAAVMLIFRAQMIGALHGIGCTLADQRDCYQKPGYWTVVSPMETRWRILHSAVLAAPIVLGAFVGAPIFSREFDQRTQVFALTQSVSRLRWWAVKITVAGMPLIGGLIALGYLTGWVDNTFILTRRAEMDDGAFQAHSIMPAVFGLLALAIAVTAGIVVRSLVGSMVTGLVVAAGVVVLVAFPLRPYLLPTTRDVTPASEVQAGPGTPSVFSDASSGGLFLGSGALDANGNAVQFDASRCRLPSQAATSQGSTMVVAQDGAVAATGDPAYDKALTEAYAACRSDQGIVAYYTDYLSASMLWPMRGAVTALCVLLAGLFLAAGAFRLRGRAGSRS